MMPAPLQAAQYPALDPAELGAYPPVGYGSVPSVPAPCIVSGSAMRLGADITQSSASLSVDDASRLPTPPFDIQIASERITVGSVAGNVLGALTRGVASTATAHAAGRTVFELRSEYVYLVSPEPVAAIHAVAVDGVAQAGGYTAYTGQSGSEHPSWPGRAVVSFSAGPWAARQRNLASAATSSVEAAVLLASHAESPARLSRKRSRAVWASFTGSGTLTSQAYSATLKNTGATDAVIRALVKDTATDAVMAHDYVLVPASATIGLALSHDAGAWQTTLMLIHFAGGSELEVTNIKKTVTTVNPPELEQTATYSPAVDISAFRGLGIERTATLKPRGKGATWASYAADSYGSIKAQSHKVTVVNTGASAARARFVACSPSGALVAYAEFAVAAGVTVTQTLSHSGGAWDTMSEVIIQSGALRVDELVKEVTYLISGESSQDTYSCTARAVIGDTVTVDADWAVDTTGDYSGVGTLIERPDYVIRHFLARMGFAPAEIDSASFSAAGAAYAGFISGGYKFGFVINEAITPSEFLRSLARQCRSIIRHARGAWKLSPVPSAAPSALRTISSDELAGAGAMFRFERVGLEELGNSLSASYARSYCGGPSWLGCAGAADAASIARLGLIARTYEFPAIRHAATVQDVLAQQLRERASALLKVEFTVFYEHFDLGVGDTVALQNPIYNGMLFCIERIERIDAFRLRISALQWWA